MSDSRNFVTDVRRTLRAQLLTVDGLPDVQQWETMRSTEGQSFPPAMGTPWFRETMLRQPGPPRRRTLGPQAHVPLTGSWQVSLFYPPDEIADVLVIETMGEAIRDAFPDTFEAMVNGRRFACLGCGLGTVTNDEVEGWVHLPVRVSWSLDTFNVN